MQISLLKINNQSLAFIFLSLALIYNSFILAFNENLFDFEQTLFASRLIIISIPVFFSILLVLSRKIITDFKFKIIILSLLVLPSALSIINSSSNQDVGYGLVFIILLISLMTLFDKGLSDFKLIVPIFQNIGIVIMSLSILFAIFIPEFAFLSGSRLNGIFTNPHTLARLAGTLLLSSFMLKENELIKKFVIYLLTFICLILSMSVNVLFSLFISFIAISLIKRLNFGMTFLITSISIIIAILLPAFPTMFIEFFGRDLSLTGRTSAWLLGVDLIVNNPFFGIGMQDTKEIIFLSNISSTNFHNSFIEAGVRGGLPLLLGFIIIISLALKGAIKCSLALENWNYLRLLIFVIALGSAQSIIFSYFTFDFYILWILLFAMSHMSTKSSHEIQDHARKNYL